MELQVSDVRVNFNFGLIFDVVTYKSGPQQDPIEKCLIRIRDSSDDKITTLELTMPAEYARSMARYILAKE